MNGGIEIIRIIAVILITFTHTRNNLSEGWGYFIIEKLPTYGTAILSIISGYLFFQISRKSSNLFSKKLRSLAIPYLIANGLVLLFVLGSYYILNYNFLNRLDYDYKIITEGLLGFNEPPINPPTYFIKDIFVLFCFITLIKNGEKKTLFFLIPLAVFGHLFHRIDIVLLFGLGVFFAYFKDKIRWKYWMILSFLAIFINSFVFTSVDLKYSVTFSIFLFFINLKLPSVNLGSFSYLLHLYHSPIMVVSYPIYSKFITSESVLIILQILTALLGAFVLYIITRKFSFFKIVAGGR